MEDFDFEFLAYVPVVGGLLALGLLSLLVPRSRFMWRMVGGGLTVAGLYGLIATAFHLTTLYAHLVVSLGGTAAAVAVVRGATAMNLARRLSTPLGYGAALTAGSLAGLTALFLQHEERVHGFHDRDMQMLDLISIAPERVAIDGLHAVTDRGNAVPVCHAKSTRPAGPDTRELETLAMLPWGDKTIKRQWGDDNSNCHGWVFTGGRYIVPGSAVGQILQDNGYLTVSSAVPGDLAVYRSPAGEIVHTAIVRYVAPGRPPMVEGKWGRLGVYLHAADESGYGNGYTLYRTSRDGDLLKGVDDSAGSRFSGSE